MTRREAIRAMMLAGAGVAASSSLVAAPLRMAGVLPGEQKFVEPAAGDQVLHRSWKTLGGESISLLGMGCMRFPRKGGSRRAPLDQEQINQMIDYALAHGINYFDTAPAYGDSERATGEALSKHKRESYFLATKMSNFRNSELEACKQMFATSLKNLRTTYFDYFLLHSIADLADFNKRFKDNGLLDWLIEQKKKGVIRHLGFSFHGSNQALRDLLALPYKWEFVQIQLNYVDWKEMPLEDNSEPCDSETLYKMLEEKDIPVVIMEPIRGGALANVSDGLKKRIQQRFPQYTPAAAALTFASTPKAIMCTLSGMSNMQPLHGLPLLHALPARRGDPGRVRRLQCAQRRTDAAGPQEQEGQGLQGEEEDLPQALCDPGQRHRRLGLRGLQRVPAQVPAAHPHPRPDAQDPQVGQGFRINPTIP